VGALVAPTPAGGSLALESEADRLRSNQEEGDHAPERSPLPAERALRSLKLNSTWLPDQQTTGLAINDLEVSATWAVPLAKESAPLLVTTALAGHWWEGPQASLPALPASLCDLYLDIGWQPRFARWLFADLGVTPGLYADFKDAPSAGFLLRGRALGIVAFSPELQVVAGLLWVNRNQVKLLPAGGVLWQPSPDTKLDLVFPQPKIAQRLGGTARAQWWGYLAGEFGGGRWATTDSSGQTDWIDYTDTRALVGLECVFLDGLKGHIEAGYAFGRKVTFSSGAAEFEPDSALLLRAGLRY